MKNVTCSRVVRLRHGSGVVHAVGPMRQMMMLGLTLAIGVPAIIFTFHLLDPGAPLGYIVFAVLAGSFAPVMAMLPARLEVESRFEARHLVGTLDDSLGALGYAQASRASSAVQYCTRQPQWRAFGANDIAVTVSDHRLEIVGPFSTLCALKQRMAY